METTLKRELFTTTTFDSGALGLLTSVVHQFATPGRYFGVVFRGEAPSGTIEFEVSESSEALQISIDLAKGHNPRAGAECSCGGTGHDVPTVSPRGYVLFFTSAGSGYAVLIGDPNSKDAPAFDSRSLGKGDLFALSLLEPTRYRVSNARSKSTGTIDVSFHREDAKRLKSLETQYVDVPRDAFHPNAIALTATQGLVFRIQDVARIVIERAEKPDKRQPARALRIQPTRPPEYPKKERRSKSGRSETGGKQHPRQKGGEGER